MALAQCANLYVIAPGNFIIDLASGATVLLDPAKHEFELFCSPEAARASLRSQIENGQLPNADWRIYTLNGSSAELAEPALASTRQSARLYLARKAALRDWIAE